VQRIAREFDGIPATRKRCCPAQYSHCPADGSGLRARFLGGSVLPEAEAATNNRRSRRIVRKTKIKGPCQMVSLECALFSGWKTGIGLD